MMMMMMRILWVVGFLGCKLNVVSGQSSQTLGKAYRLAKEFCSSYDWLECNKTDTGAVQFGYSRTGLAVPGNIKKTASVDIYRLSPHRLRLLPKKEEKKAEEWWQPRVFMPFHKGGSSWKSAVETTEILATTKDIFPMELPFEMWEEVSSQVPVVVNVLFEPRLRAPKCKLQQREATTPTTPTSLTVVVESEQNRSRKASLYTFPQGGPVGPASYLVKVKETDELHPLQKYGYIQERLEGLNARALLMKMREEEVTAVVDSFSVFIDQFEGHRRAHEAGDVVDQTYFRFHLPVAYRQLQLEFRDRARSRLLLFGGLYKAMKELWSAGLMHCDSNPSNIMLSRGFSRNVELTDSRRDSPFFFLPGISMHSTILWANQTERVRNEGIENFNLYWGNIRYINTGNAIELNSSALGVIRHHINGGQCSSNVTDCIAAPCILHRNQKVEDLELLTTFLLKDCLDAQQEIDHRVDAALEGHLRRINDEYLSSVRRREQEQSEKLAPSRETPSQENRNPERPADLAAEMFAAEMFASLEDLKESRRRLTAALTRGADRIRMILAETGCLGICARVDLLANSGSSAICSLTDMQNAATKIRRTLRGISGEITSFFMPRRAGRMSSKVRYTSPKISNGPRSLTTGMAALHVSSSKPSLSSD